MEIADRIREYKARPVMQAHFPTECGCRQRPSTFLHIHVGAASMSVDNDFTLVRRLTNLADVCAYVFVFWICVDTGPAQWIPVFSNDDVCVWWTLYFNVYRSTVRHSKCLLLVLVYRGFECSSSALLLRRWIPPSPPSALRLSTCEWTCLRWNKVLSFELLLL